jgi:hypothetical protein
MRLMVALVRGGLAALVCAGLLVVAGGAPTAAAGHVLVATHGTTVCTITDHRLIGLSGLIVTKDGFIAISDSNPDKSAIRIWYIDKHCKLIKSVGYPTSAYDPEDAAIGRDGSLYVADIGDNDHTRTRIAIWKLAAGHSTPKLYRYSYPDGAHDAEAILLAADDTPIFVTKDPLTAEIYVPTAPADPSGKPVRLKKVGSFTLTPTDTSSGVGILGGFVVTGGANSPDRRRVALRSYSDAYEWDVPDGDVVKAITTTKPRITPLPDEPQGESIAYGLDGRDFYTVSDQEVTPVKTPILRYTPVRPAVPSPTRSVRASTTVASSTPNRRSGLFIGATVLGLVLIGAGGWGAMRSRRRRI